MSINAPESKPQLPPEPPWTLRVATVAGIPIRIHATFLLVLAYAWFIGGSAHFLLMSAFILVIFMCVVLHELGHSRVALHYGIPVSQITLYPIGGIANIEKRPTPKQELWIALAGPAVNLVIAGLLFVVLPKQPFSVLFSQLADPTTVKGFLTVVMTTNALLALFNMLPAFPMDGGRVLRSLLALALPEQKATVIAARIGQFLAFTLGLYALSQGKFFLVAIAYFVYTSAAAEAGQYRQNILVSGLNVRQAMLTHIVTLSVGDTLRHAAEVLLDTTQHDFPVLHGDSLTGLLTRNDLLRGLARIGPDGFVAGSMNREPALAGPEDDLSSALEKLSELEGPLLVVDPDDGKLLGMVTTDNVQELFAIRRIASAAAR